MEEITIPIIAGNDWNYDSINVLQYTRDILKRYNNRPSRDRVEIMRNVMTQLFNAYPNDPNIAGSMYSYADAQRLHRAINDALNRENDLHNQQGGKRRTRRNSRKRKTRKHKVKNNKK
jgi:hypothetical protein